MTITVDSVVLSERISLQWQSFDVITINNAGAILVLFLYVEWKYLINSFHSKNNDKCFTNQDLSFQEKLIHCLHSLHWLPQKGVLTAWFFPQWNHQHVWWTIENGLVWVTFKPQTLWTSLRWDEVWGKY